MLHLRGELQRHGAREVRGESALAPYFALLGLAATTISCDQVTKQLAAEHLADEPRQSFLGDTLRLEYAENSGAFLSLGAQWPEWARTSVLIVGTALLLLALAVAAVRGRWRPGARLGLVLVLAGGVSNLADRVSRGAVIDFVNLGIGSLRTGIFNVADVAILVGAALLFACRGERTDAALRMRSG